MTARLLLTLAACTETPVVQAERPPTRPDPETDNQPPTALSDTLPAIRYGGSFLVDVVANDFDPDGDPLDLVETTEAGLGRVEIVDTTTLRYTHDGPQWGEESFQYTITDGRGGTDTTSVYFDVGAPPSLGVLEPPPGATLAAGPVPVRFAVERCDLHLDTPTGCRIAPTLDGVPLAPLDTDVLVVDAETNGEHTVTALLTGPGGAALEPRAEVTIRWTTVGGREPWEHPGPLVLASDAAMAAFCADGFTAVRGDLSIDPTTATDTAALACLARVDGDLVVGPSSLESLELPALASIGGVLRLEDAAALRSVALPALQRALLGVSLRRLPALVDVDLRGLERIGGDLWLQELPSLGQLDLSSLQTVEDLLLQQLAALDDVELPSLIEVDGHLDVWASATTTLLAPRLEQVAHLGLFGERLATVDLSSLHTVSGDLRLFLTDVVAFDLPALRSTGGELDLFGNAALTSLDLPLLEHVGGGLSVDDADQLTALSLPSLLDAGPVSIVDCGDLQSVGAPVAVTLGGLRLQYDAALTTLDLRAVTRIGTGATSELFVGDNAVLATLDGFGALTTVDGALSIVDNPSLPTAAATAFADALTVLHGVTIQGNQ